MNTYLVPCHPSHHPMQNYSCEYVLQSFAQPRFKCDAADPALDSDISDLSCITQCLILGGHLNYRPSNLLTSLPASLWMSFAAETIYLPVAP